MGKLSELLKNPYNPIAIYRSASIPEDSERSSGEHCVIKAYYLPAVKEGKSVYGNTEDIYCGGAWTGLNMGLPENRSSVPDTISECQGYFENSVRAKKNYLNIAKPYKPTSDYIVFEPLELTLKRGIEPDVVSFFADPLHISALMDLAGYGRKSDDFPVAMRYAYGCEQVYLLPYLEGRKRNPQCIVGLTEFYVRKFIDEDKFSFSMPYSIYKQMDANAENSFLTKVDWDGSKKKGNLM